MRQIITTREQLDALPRLTVIAQFFAARPEYNHPPGILVYVRKSYGWQNGEDTFDSSILIPGGAAEPRTFEVLYNPDEEG